MNIKGWAITIISVLVAIILIFNLVGTTSSDLNDASDSITDANNCTDGTDGASDNNTAYYYSLSDGYCYNSSAQKYVAGQIDMPLNGLFGRGSVIMLVLMASLLIAIIGIVMKMKKN